MTVISKITTVLALVALGVDSRGGRGGGRGGRGGGRGGRGGGRGPGGRGGRWQCSANNGDTMTAPTLCGDSEGNTWAALCPDETEADFASMFDTFPPTKPCDGQRGKPSCREQCPDGEYCKLNYCEDGTMAQEYSCEKEEMLCQDGVTAPTFGDKSVSPCGDAGMPPYCPQSFAVEA